MLISVIIPTHNRCDLLGRAIESVQKQTINDIEIIVVSDGSEDGTDEIMKKYIEDPRVKYISYFPARGGNVARNIGIKNSIGDYIAFLDDDDEWLPTKLEKQIHVLEMDSNVGLVYTGVHTIYVDEKIEYKSLSIYEGDASKRILIDNFIGSTSTVMLKKSVLNKAGSFDEEMPALQDFDLWIRVCQYVNVGLVPEELVNYYNYGNGGQVSSNTEKYEKAYSLIDMKYKREISNLSLLDKKKREANKFFLLGNKGMRNNNPILARYYFRKYLKLFFSIKILLYYILSFTNYSFILKLRSKLI